MRRASQKENASFSFWLIPSNYKQNMFDTKKIKSYFPIFQAHPELHYLDSGASTQTPQVVLDAMNDYYTKYRANTHRGMYDIAERATDEYEGARATVAKFINADQNEIIFIAGTTHGMNLLAYTLCGRLTHRDNVVLTRMEHHANLVPWQQMAKHYGFELRFIELAGHHPLEEVAAGGFTTPLRGSGSSRSSGGVRSLEHHTTTGNDARRSHTPRPVTANPLKGVFDLDLNSARKLIDENTKIVSFTFASNVLGTVNPAKEIVALAKKVRAITIIDAAQAIAHFPIDVKEIDCDWLVFSGHKMYGPTGTGGLFGKKIMLEEHIEPFFFGGDMVLEVSYESATWTEAPYRFEAGTQNIAGVIGLGAACKFIEEIGWNAIIEHEQSLTNQLINQLTNNGLQIIGPKTTYNRIGVMSFVMPGVHPHDIGEIMGSVNVAIRAGNHCAMPLHKLLGLFATARASLGVYNTKEDIDGLIEGIKKTQKLFKSV